MVALIDRKKRERRRSVAGTSPFSKSGTMFSLRRNRAFLIKIVLLTPLTWLCVVLYMNSSTKIIQQSQQGHQEQIVYVNDNKAEENLLVQEQLDQNAREVKGPPLKDNLLRKKKPTPSGGSLTFASLAIRYRRDFQ